MEQDGHAAVRMPNLQVTTIDYHTAGEPFRIVTGGVPDIPGSDVLERRTHAQTDPSVDEIRQLLVQEPRGHADIYGCFLVPPNDEVADLGVLFWHTDGYSTTCGHSTIALGVWAVETGRVRADPDGVTEVVVDVPSGRVAALVRCVGGKAVAASFRNIPSCVLGRDIPLVTSRGEVAVDLCYSGAIYASVPASAFGLEVRPDKYAELLTIGREVKWLLEQTSWSRHPTDQRLGGVCCTILYDDLGDGEAGPHQRNLTVFADGEADRSPCGSGTAARVALLAEEGRILEGQTFIHDSILGSRFLARVAGRTFAAGRSAFVAEVEGMAYRRANTCSYSTAATH